MATITVTMRRAGGSDGATASVSASVTGSGSGHELSARDSPASRPERGRELAFHDVAVDRQDAEAHAVGAPTEGLHVGGGDSEPLIAHIEHADDGDPGT